MNGRFALTSRPFLANDGAGGGGPNSGGSGGDGVQFDAKQQERVNALLAEERRAAEKRVEDRLKAKADEDKAERDRQAQIDADKAKSDFEAAEKKLQADLQAAKDDAKAAREENEKLREAMKAGVEARWGELPEKIQKLYKGPEDDVLGRWAHLNDPDVAEIAKELAGTNEKKETLRGAGGDPPRGESGDPKADEAARMANALRYG